MHVVLKHNIQCTPRGTKIKNLPRLLQNQWVYWEKSNWNALYVYYTNMHVIYIDRANMLTLYPCNLLWVQTRSRELVTLYVHPYSIHNKIEMKNYSCICCCGNKCSKYCGMWIKWLCR